MENNKSTREKAILWWNNKSTVEQIKLNSTWNPHYVLSKSLGLTGRQIEDIYIKQISHDFVELINFFPNGKKRYDESAIFRIVIHSIYNEKLKETVLLQTINILMTIIDDLQKNQK